MYHSERLYCLHEYLSVNSACRFLSPSVTNSQVKLAARRQEFILKPNLSYPKRESELSYGANFHRRPGANAGRTVVITALQFVRAVLKWTLHSYLVGREKLGNYKRVTRHIKINKCKITLLVNFLCHFP